MNSLVDNNSIERNQSWAASRPSRGWVFQSPYLECLNYQNFNNQVNFLNCSWFHYPFKSYFQFVFFLPGRQGLKGDQGASGKVELSCETEDVCLLRLEEKQLYEGKKYRDYISLSKPPVINALPAFIHYFWSQVNLREDICVAEWRISKWSKTESGCLLPNRDRSGQKSAPSHWKAETAAPSE